MSAPARHLHAVDENGEVIPPEILAYQDEIKGLQRALKAEIRRYENLLRDKEAEAQASQHWPQAVIIFKAWRKATGHKRSGFGYDRFSLVEPFLKKANVYGPEVCLRAVAGIAFDHNTKVRKNGRVERYDGWDLVFRDSEHVERYANRAPNGWRDDPVLADALEQIKVRQR